MANDAKAKDESKVDGAAAPNPEDQGNTAANEKKHDNVGAADLEKVQ